MIKNALVVLLCAFAVAVSGQSSDTERAIVSYDDGSVFIGQLISRDHPAWKMQLTTMDTISIHPGRIKRVLSDREVFFFARNRYHAKRSIFFNTSLTAHFGWNSSVQWDGTFGMSFTERLDLGVGIGISGHDTDLGNDWIFSEFVNLYGYGRYYLSKGFVRFYGDVKLGYGLPNSWGWETDYSGGFYAQPGIGAVFASKGIVKWNLAVGQYMINTKGSTSSFVGPGNWAEVDYSLWYNRTVFQVGLSIMLLPGQLREIGFY